MKDHHVEDQDCWALRPHDNVDDEQQGAGDIFANRDSAPGAGLAYTERSNGMSFQSGKSLSDRQPSDYQSDLRCTCTLQGPSPTRWTSSTTRPDP